MRIPQFELSLPDEPFRLVTETATQTIEMPEPQEDERQLTIDDTPKPMTTRALIEKLKEADQDHEFYPTTNEIIKKLIADLIYLSKEFRGDHGYRNDPSFSSFMDIGAGNGKVLKAVKDAVEGYEEPEGCRRYPFRGMQYYAIEKSHILCQQLDPSVMIVGTDFEEQTLFSKDVTVMFSNPPYSQYEQWAEKIIKQGACSFAYLVIPQRWEQSVVIQDAIKWRGAKVEKVGAFDFEDSEDRRARAKVHLLRVVMPENGDDPFDRFFEQEFAGLYAKYGKDNPSDDDKEDGPTARKVDPKERFAKLVPGPTYPEALVALYNDEMARVHRNYKLAGELDADLLKEFDMHPQKIMSCLKARLTGMRTLYWEELFSRLEKVTGRLTSKTRKQLLETLNKHTQVDFTHNNILAVVIWVINNANQYIEQQVIDVYEHMVDKCNARLYKSNKKVWTDNEWRYVDERKHITHYALDYRIVTHRVGGIADEWRSWGNCLAERATDFIGDLRTIAGNLGFIPQEGELQSKLYTKWSPGVTRTFYQQNGEVLMDVRAFKNHNLHLRLNKDFILALNVEHGRLKGWVNTPQEAAEELGDPKAASYFKTNHQLAISNPGFLLTQ